jgi:hypothetical protein
VVTVLGRGVTAVGTVDVAVVLVGRMCAHCHLRGSGDLNLLG